MVARGIVDADAAVGGDLGMLPLEPGRHDRRAGECETLETPVRRRQRDDRGCSRALRVCSHGVLASALCSARTFSRYGLIALARNFSVGVPGDAAIARLSVVCSRTPSFRARRAARAGCSRLPPVVATVIATAITNSRSRQPSAAWCAASTCAGPPLPASRSPLRTWVAARYRFRSKGVNPESPSVRSQGRGCWC